MEDNNELINYRDNRRYTFDDYREEIKAILDFNKGDSGSRGHISITKILKDVGVSSGNYYAFMRGGVMRNGVLTMPLSYKKLDMILDALKKESNTISSKGNNRGWLRTMSDEELAEFIEERVITNPRLNQIDFLAWLRSADPAFIYKDKKDE